MLEVGQRRVMRDGTYVRVESIGPNKTDGGFYVVIVSIAHPIMVDMGQRVPFGRAYGTVAAWPLAQCHNVRHHSLTDCSCASAECGPFVWGRTVIAM